MGGAGKIVEADETFIGGKEKNKHNSKCNADNIGGMGKEAVFSLVERGGKVRSRHVANVTAKTLKPVLTEQLDKASSLMTDGEGQYRILGSLFARHEAVNHGIGEYVRGDAHTNTVEGYFSILKRGIAGIYHHVSEAHLKRYLGEFDFRYNERMGLSVEDAERATKAIKGVVGKRLTYQQPDSDQVLSLLAALGGAVGSLPLRLRILASYVCLLGILISTMLWWGIRHTTNYLVTTTSRLIVGVLVRLLVVSHITPSLAF
jgi:hypothetical protein